MTSAPMSAMIWVQYGPITIAVRSMTRSPAIGPVGLAIERFLAGRAVRQLEAVADVLVVSIRDDRKNEWRRDVPDRLQVVADLLDGPRRPAHARALGDDRPSHATRQRDEHFPGHRAGFVCEPTHDGRDQFRA